MERGTYVAASAGMAQLAKIQVVTNNLANIDTPGYKRQGLVGELQSFEQTLAATVAPNDPYAKGDHDRTPGVRSVKTVNDFTQGPIHQTSNPLDAALARENDFFVVTTPSGSEYTRAGNFSLNSAGDIVTPDGYPVAGEGGALNIGSGTLVKISPDGSITSDGQVVGKIQTVHFEDPSVLVPNGSTRFKLAAGGAAPTTVPAQIVPEALEQSNVSAITSIVDLIAANRGFEQYTKAAQGIDQLNRLMIGQLGRE